MLLALVSQTQSLINLLTATLISTAMIGVGIRGLFKADLDRRKPERGRVRWLWLCPGVVGGGLATLLALTELRLEPRSSGGLFAIIGLPVALIVAPLLLAKGWRGRRVGDHPHCRRCGFDLFGKPAGSDVCSECGADLSASGATTVGIRVRRLRLVLGGVFVLILSIALGAVAVRDLKGWRTLNRLTATWIQYQPEWWLVQDLKASQPRRVLAALDELERRLSGGSLSTSSAEKLVAATVLNKGLSYAAILALQAWSEDRLSEETMRAVMKRSLQVTLHVAPQSARGHAVRVKLELGDRFLSLGGWPARGVPGDTTVQVSPLRWRLHDMELPPEAMGKTPYRERALIGALRGAPTSISLAPLGSDLQSGVVRVQVTGEVVLTVAQPGRPTLVEKQSFDLTGTTTIVEPVVLHCQPVVAADLRPIHIDDETPATGPADLAAPPSLPIANLYSNPDGTGQLILSMTYFGAFLGDVFERSAGIERKLGNVLIESSAMIDLDAPLPADAELILRPTPERGVELFSTLRTFQTEMVIPAVAIERHERDAAGIVRPAAAP